MRFMFLIHTAYTGGPTPALMEALAAGAQGYLLKDQDGPSIAHRLAMIEHGEVPISPAIARRLLAPPNQASCPSRHMRARP